MRPFHVLLNLSSAVVIALHVSAARAQPIIGDVAGLLSLINPQCADFRILGPCSCTGVDPACLQVAYHQPAYIVETAPIPGDTVIGAGLMSPGAVLTTRLQNLDGAGGASARPQTSGHAALTFLEAHVYGVPKLLSYGCHACDGSSVPEAPTLVPHYLSELDFAAWRRLATGVGNPLPLTGLTRVGVWGPLFPRIGFSQHDSPPVAAALLAWRAMAVAFNPAPAPGGLLPRTVLAPAIGEPPTCFQVGYPQRSRCGRVGMNPLHWQLEKVEARGRNVFVFWAEKTCCVAPVTAVCGLALSLGHDDNFCPLGYDPVFARVPGMPLDVPFDGK